MLEIMRVPGRAVVNVAAGEIVSVFAHVERADQNAARSFETRDHCRVRLGRRVVAVDLGAGSGRQPFDIEQVLHSEGRASKRAQVLSAHAGRIDGVSLGERALRGHLGEGAERAVSGFDAVEGLLRDLAGAHRARSDRRGDRLGGSLNERGAHAVKTGAGSAKSSSGTERSLSACSAAIRRCTMV